MKRILHIVISLIVISAVFSSCSWFGGGKDDDGIDKVMVLYSAGFNSLSSQLKEDIMELQSGYVPAKDAGNVLLVASHNTSASGNYSSTTRPVLIRLYKEKESAVVMDTIAALPSGSTLTRAQEMRQMLQYVSDIFPSKSYGIVFSSHATGWLPAGYYENPTKYDSSAGSGQTQFAPRRFVFPDGAVPYTEPEVLPGPQVKSIGQTRTYEDGAYVSYELSLEDFVGALPFRCDYILFDACLMGGIETAYALKDVCGKVGFSQAEVLADGFDYDNIASRLLLGTEPDPEAVCRDYFERYNALSGEMQSATISLVDCKALGSLTDVCRTLFDKYRSAIEALDFETVQRYYRSYHHWYFDLEDILLKAGISSSEKSALEAALDECIIYKGATEGFLPGSSGFYIDTFSGLSMYLPSAGSSYLDAFYKTLDWNKASGLVE